MKDQQKTGSECQRPRLAGLLVGLAALATWLPGGATSLAGSAHADCAVLAPDPAATATESREPGLIVRFTEVRSQRSDSRAARLSALHVPSGEPPTPFLEPGPFEAVWEGWMEIAEEDAYTFRFVGNGRIEVTIGETAALRTVGEAVGEPVRLAEGFHALHVRYRSPDEGPARMRLLWSSSQFGPEPISPTALSHDGSDAALRQANRLRQGRTVMAERRCLKCHQPENASIFDASPAMPELSLDAPSLMGVGSRLRADWMQKWVANPQGVRPSAKMPHIVANDKDAADIAAYLATLGEPPEKAQAADATRTAEGGRLYAMQGCVGCHTLGPSANDGRLVLGNVSGKWHGPALKAFLRNPAQHYAWTGMPDFRLSEVEAAALAAFLLDQSKPASTTFVNGDAKRGMQLVQQLGCVGCHAAPVENLHTAPSLLTLMNSDWQGGCVAEETAARGNAPRVALSSSEREALRALAQEGFESLQRRSLVEFAARQIEMMDCRACHRMDGQVDRWTEHAEEVAHLISDPDENPFAQHRPALTWLGEKLQPDWLANVLAGKLEREPRPWMEARMPSIGPDPLLLAKALAAAHGLDDDFQPPQADSQLVSRGRSLATGIGGGFWCHSCHGASGAGVPSVDLSLIGERLRPEFYHWKMRTPRRVDAETPMPAFADAEGRTRLRDILGGDAQRQFEAIWHFLLDSRADRVAQRGERAGPPEWRPGWTDHYKDMDTGPFYSGVIEAPTAGRMDKGLAIRVGEQQQATLHFDTDLLRMSAGWTGDFLTFRSNEDYGTRNSPPPSAAGDVWFANPEVTGWAARAEPRFTDTRGRRFGPIPEEQGRYHGLYLHGRRVVLSYAVRETEVRESPWFVQSGDAGAFVRDLQINPHEQALSVLLFAGGSDVEVAQHGPLQIASAGDEERVTVAAVRAGVGGELVASGRHVALRFEPHSGKRTVRVLIWEGDAGRRNTFLALAEAASDPDDLDRLAQPGPALWGEPLLTKGELDNPHGPYAVDVLTAPQKNPFNALLHFTGIDFLPDGRAVLSTMHGDVWLVDGIDESLERLRWQRFATGLNNPFGVRVVNGKIYVSGEDELTLLHDRSGNGEADYYENFRNLIAPGAGAWRQAFGLEVDAAGNFYFARGRGRAQTDQSNGVVRVSPDGRKMEVIASGFRQPFGIGISPAGHVTISQQEGTWVPQTPVHKVDIETRQGSFYGYDPNRNRKETPYPRELGYEPPLVWLPRNVDNSGAGQVWVNSDAWGLPRDQMLHLSYGQRSLMQLIHEEVDGDRQGGVVHITRLKRAHPRAGRFHPQDGQLYVVGHAPGGTFERVRHTGQKAHLPVALNAHENGLRIRFNHPLNSAVAGSTAGYTVHRWNYRWTGGYGSEFYSVKNPDRLGEDPVAVLSVTLLNGGREVFLEIPDMTPVMQMRIAYRLEAADGTTLESSIYNTVHALGPAFLNPLPE